MRKFNHFGVPSCNKQEEAVFNDGLRVWLTDYTNSENRIEHLKFEEGSCMPDLIQKVAHIAYEVPCLTTALEGKTVIFGPADVDDQLSIAFIEEEGIPVELMCFKK